MVPEAGPLEADAPLLAAPGTGGTVSRLLMEPNELLMDGAPASCRHCVSTTNLYSYVPNRSVSVVRYTPWLCVLQRRRKREREREGEREKKRDKCEMVFK